MATRSGKRIRSMFHESTTDENVVCVVQSERKTRSKRVKENSEDLCINLLKGKKRNNYVHYPTDDELQSDAVESEDTGVQQTRSTRKNTLKDRNTIAVSENTEDIDTKCVRTTRRTKKTSESNIENVPDNISSNKTRKNKKKRRSNDGTETVPKKTKSRKKKGKTSNSTADNETEIMNKTSASNDSFHSATESPTKLNYVQPLITKKGFADNLDSETLTTETISTGNDGEHRKRKSSIKTNNTTFEVEEIKTTLKRKSSIQNTDVPSKKQSLNTSYNPPSYITATPDHITHTPTAPISNESSKEIMINTTFEIEEIKQSPVKRRSSVKNIIQNVNETQSIINTTYDKNDSTDNINITYEKVNVSNNIDIKSLNSNSKKRKSEPVNTTFDKETPVEMTKRLSINATKRVSSQREFSVASGSPSSLNHTYDKVETANSEPAISNQVSDFDISKSEEKLNATFDKTSKSSLISTDSENGSRISITSDDSSITPSKTIMNTTPVLIESSMDESLIKDAEESTVTVPITPLKRENTFTKDGEEIAVTVPITPLTREDTFTKDGPEFDSDKKLTPTAPKHTPVKSMSLPSPGCTPFPNKSSQNRVMNVTRSIEKSRRSSLADVVPRTTKVMFCSPVDNPVMASQQKRKIIKSNLKGSNKSFVVEENEPVRREVLRKRSYTHNDADETRRKRKCAAEAAEPPRKRTFSATAKLSEPATPKKLCTPLKSRPDSKSSRTKLPNFAALHQKQFDKMESLDECQERKAKRAKQLLTPTGNLAVLERISPKSSTTDLQKEQPKTETKKTPYDFKINHESKPGYSRFGFKLNVDLNPFSVPTKNNSKVKPKPAMIRQATLPSLTGTTSARREAAKQVVMREKSFTDKRTGRIQESRTIIKGVRTNRRFDLQMRLRNLD